MNILSKIGIGALVYAGGKLVKKYGDYRYQCGKAYSDKRVELLELVIRIDDELISRLKDDLKKKEGA